MPNTPAMIQSGACGLHASENVSGIQKTSEHPARRGTHLLGERRANGCSNRTPAADRPTFSSWRRWAAAIRIDLTQKGAACSPANQHWGSRMAMEARTPWPHVAEKGNT
ncbi:hypothetical protein [endosymbiont of Lamellibrachia barhami]|uniref:hypothetical protein n=1 Tax=endosymbiont of Lamellibrachia barhami TaxID=205975 RepID=UPI0015A9B62B|nr:hypothetical protein [endosymbiont of Lamellibrachia barhami]